MKTISRTIEKTTIEAEAVYAVNGEIGHRPLVTVVTNGKVDNLGVKIQKYFKEQLKAGETLVIKNTKTEEKIFTVPVDEFIKLAEKLESENKEEVKEETETQPN